MLVQLFNIQPLKSFNYINFTENKQMIKHTISKLIFLNLLNILYIVINPIIITAIEIKSIVICLLT